MQIKKYKPSVSPLVKLTLSKSTVSFIPSTKIANIPIYFLNTS